MIEEFNFLTDIYKKIYYWLAGTTPGEHTCISYFKQYDKNVWDKIKNKIIELENKNRLSKIEKEFIKCKYEGKAYRVINYNSRNKGHVCITNTYQSCSKNIEGIKNVNLYGNKILINLIAVKETYAIDVFELLSFMIKNKIINIQDMERCNLYNLEKYLCEKEVVVPLTKESIENIKVIDLKNNILKEIPKNEWYRKNLY